MQRPLAVGGNDDRALFVVVFQEILKCLFYILIGKVKGRPGFRCIENIKGSQGGL
jgi:hypothetical protein